MCYNKCVREKNNGGKMVNDLKIESGIVNSRIPEGEDEVFILTSKDFTNSSISNTFGTTIKCNKEKMEKYMLKKGDIIIKTLYPFEVLYIENDNNIIMTNLALKISSDKISSISLLEILCSKEFQNHLEKYGVGTTIIRLNKKIIETFEINSCNVEEAEENFMIRKLINLKEEEVKLLKELIGG